MLSLGYKQPASSNASSSIHAISLCVCVCHIGIFDCLALNVTSLWICCCCCCSCYFHSSSLFFSRLHFIWKTWLKHKQRSFVHSTYYNMTSEQPKHYHYFEIFLYLMEEIVCVCVFTAYLIRIMI